MRPRPATPPITPPAIAPTGVLVVGDIEEVGKGEPDFVAEENLVSTQRRHNVVSR